MVFEIRSPSNTAKDMADKLAFYDRFGVEEYYVWRAELEAARAQEERTRADRVAALAAEAISHAEREAAQVAAASARAEQERAREFGVEI